MKILTIESSVNRNELEYEDYRVNTKCTHQSGIADNDRLNFLIPMAEYIAHLIISDDQ